MGWHYQIKDHAPHQGGIPYEYEDNYWEINLMCHLLKDYPYEQMLNAKASDAMIQFRNRVSEIDDEDDGPNQLELKKFTKGRLYGTLTALTVLFRAHHPNMKMKELYCAEEGSVANAIVKLFEHLQDIIAEDTAAQIAHSGQGKRFKNACGLCLPFLPRLTVPPTEDPVPGPIMEDHIEHLGAYTLETLYRKPYHLLSDEEKAALIDARKHRILSSPRRNTDEGALVIDFGNDLVCNPATNHCEPETDKFCTEADDGTCTAMSS